MKIYRGFSDPRLKPHPRAVAIGVFDGVHRGHQKIIRSMRADARRLKFSPCVVTFDPHPEHVLGRRSSDTGVLLSLEHRLRLFESLGARECVVVKFNRAFSRVSAGRFLNDYLIRRLGMRSLSVGRGFRFGRKAEGDESLLRLAAREKKFRFHAIDPLRAGREIISSTRIRRLILEGRLAEASRLLGRAYAVVGTVVPGRGRGRRIGFPTANLDPHHEILPPEGVYAACGRTAGRVRPAAVSIGPRPTFGDRQKSLEVHFPGLRRGLYGEEVELEFKKRLRSIRRFADPGALHSAIEADIRKTLKIFKIK